jgi:hypothetical protein
VQQEQQARVCTGCTSSQRWVQGLGGVLDCDTVGLGLNDAPVYKGEGVYVLLGVVSMCTCCILQ